MFDMIEREIARDAEIAVRELIEAARLTEGQILVIGCSSSEMIGQRIGKNSSMEAAVALYEAIAPILAEKGIYLAAQCCEHLNRAIIIERTCAEKYGLDPVWVKPQPKAGGSFATTAWEHMTDPVAVETVKAHAGMDIGGTLIGMHLRRVAVPVRLSVSKIGEASLICARTRPAYIGGPRAQYQTEEP
ncbi:MAG: TIGR01440 family protein [Clostridia bacterium]|nr:TIGR01440 family protein [Clostridia bacterium]